MTEVKSRSKVSSWAYAIRTTNPPPDAPIDAVTRWLVVTRAAVLPMTLVSGLVAALLAIGEPGLDWRWLVLALVGITLAHVANNLMNDLFDTQVGTDSANYPRALYAPHPVLSGLVSRRTLLVSILLVNVADLAILVVLTLARGWPVLAFALAGFLLSVAYTAPPLRLKKHGLGEPDVFVVWGPLMVCGTYYSAVGTVGWDIVLASLPYGLLCTTVLMGKHIDKIPVRRAAWNPHSPSDSRRRARPGRHAGDDGRLLRAGRGGGCFRRDAMARASRRACAAAAMEGLAAVPPSTARRTAAGLPRLAVVVRRAGLCCTCVRRVRCWCSDSQSAPS